jgi:hypothetical protein
MKRKIATVTGMEEAVAVYYDADWEEYTVRIVGAAPNTAYHTDDREDAMSTARFLAGQEPNP